MQAPNPHASGGRLSEKMRSIMKKYDAAAASPSVDSPASPASPCGNSNPSEKDQSEQSPSNASQVSQFSTSAELAMSLQQQHQERSFEASPIIQRHQQEQGAKDGDMRCCEACLHAVAVKIEHARYFENENVEKLFESIAPQYDNSQSTDHTCIKGGTCMFCSQEEQGTKRSKKSSSYYGGQEITHRNSPAHLHEVLKNRESSLMVVSAPIFRNEDHLLKPLKEALRLEDKKSRKIEFGHKLSLGIVSHLLPVLPKYLVDVLKITLNGEDNGRMKKQSGNQKDAEAETYITEVLDCVARGGIANVLVGLNDLFSVTPSNSKSKKSTTSEMSPKVVNSDILKRAPTAVRKHVKIKLDQFENFAMTTKKKFDGLTDNNKLVEIQCFCKKLLSNDSSALEDIASITESLRTQERLSKLEEIGNRLQSKGKPEKDKTSEILHRVGWFFASKNGSCTEKSLDDTIKELTNSIDELQQQAKEGCIDEETIKKSFEDLYPYFKSILGHNPSKDQLEKLGNYLCKTSMSISDTLTQKNKKGKLVVLYLTQILLNPQVKLLSRIVRLTLDSKIYSKEVKDLLDKEQEAHQDLKTKQRCFGASEDNKRELDDLRVAKGRAKQAFESLSKEVEKDSPELHCRGCERAFKGKHGLAIHLATNTTCPKSTKHNAPKTKCEGCGKSFKRTAQHLATSTTCPLSKKYNAPKTKCEGCEKEFISVAIHLGNSTTCPLSKKYNAPETKCEGCEIFFPRIAQHLATSTTCPKSKKYKKE